MFSIFFQEKKKIIQIDATMKLFKALLASILASIMFLFFLVFGSVDGYFYSYIINTYIHYICYCVSWTVNNDDGC